MFVREQHNDPATTKISERVPSVEGGNTFALGTVPHQHCNTRWHLVPLLNDTIWKKNIVPSHSDVPEKYISQCINHIQFNCFCSVDAYIELDGSLLPLRIELVYFLLLKNKKLTVTGMVLKTNRAGNHILSISYPNILGMGLKAWKSSYSWVQAQNHSIKPLLCYSWVQK